MFVLALQHCSADRNHRQAAESSDPTGWKMFIVVQQLKHYSLSTFRWLQAFTYFGAPVQQLAAGLQSSTLFEAATGVVRTVEYRFSSSLPVYSPIQLNWLQALRGLWGAGTAARCRSSVLRVRGSYRLASPWCQLQPSLTTTIQQQPRVATGHGTLYRGAYKRCLQLDCCVS